jgi:hypothetical protein
MSFVPFLLLVISIGRFSEGIPFSSDTGAQGCICYGFHKSHQTTLSEGARIIGDLDIKFLDFLDNEVNLSMEKEALKRVQGESERYSINST